jgi:outer membrane lipoprotein carrier protein
VVTGRTLIAVALYSLTLSLHSGHAKPLAQVPDALKKVEKRYQEAGSLQAKFEQEEVSKTLNNTQMSQGKLIWRSPNQLRWETETPDRNLLVSDGQTIWFYTPPFDETEKGQVIIRKTKQVKSKLLDALLAGRFSAAVKQGLRIDMSGENTFSLLPARGPKREGIGGIKWAQVRIDPVNHHITQVSLEYRDGNRSSIKLSAIELGKPIPAESFKFKIPPRTDILKE